VAVGATPDVPLPSLGGTLAATLLVLAIVGAALWLLRRGTLRFGPRRGPARLAIETALSLGERRSLVIVAVEGRRLLLGLTSMQVTMLTELMPGAPGTPDANTSAAPYGDTTVTPSGTFGQRLDARISAPSTPAS
jgi:flagellar biosynthetic protein FliO